MKKSEAIQVQKQTVSANLGMVMLFVFLAVPHFAHAEVLNNLGNLLGIGNITSVVVGKLLFYFAVIANFTAGILIVFITWVLSLVLTMNGDIVNSPVVQAGFPVMLSLANLGFVLGIIVIAISTILRKQTYGIKEILWKLVVMAVLVNFGLVIAGSIVKFADELTLYFIREINPGDDLYGFATKIAGAFQPQNFHFVESLKNLNPTDVNQISNALEIGAENTARLIQNAIGLLIGLFAMNIVIIVLAVLVAMLLYRYIKIALALVLLPMAWLSWVFPATQDNFRRWWKGFMHQTFFAPIVVFFIWLMLVTAEKMGPGSNDPLRKHFENATEPKGELFATMNAFFSGLFGSVLANVLQSFVLVGILMGGIIAANEFGIKLADAAQKGVDGVKGWMTGALSRGARRAGVATAQGLRIRQAAEGLQKVGATDGIVKRTLKAPIRALGKGIETIAGAPAGTQLVSEYKERHKGLTGEQIINRARAATGPELAALLDLAKDKKILSQAVKNVPEERLDEAIFARYGQGRLLEEIQTVSGIALRDQAPKFEAYAEKKKRGEKLTEEEEKEQEKFWNVLRKMGSEGLGAFLTKETDPNKIPLGLSPETLSQIQHAMARGIAMGFTGSDVGNLARDLSQSQIEVLKAAGNAVDLRMNDIGPSRKWFDGNGARSAGITPEDFLGVKALTETVNPSAAGEGKSEERLRAEQQLKDLGFGG